MADTSTPDGDHGSLPAATPTTLVPDPGAAAQNVVPRGGLIVFNADTDPAEFTLMLGGATILVVTINKLSTFILDAVITVNDTETLEGTITAVVVSAPLWTASWMHTD